MTGSLEKGMRVCATRSDPSSPHFLASDVFEMHVNHQSFWSPGVAACTRALLCLDWLEGSSFLRNFAM